MNRRNAILSAIGAFFAGIQKARADYAQTGCGKYLEAIENDLKQNRCIVIYGGDVLAASNVVQFLQYQMPDGTTRVQVTMDLPNRPDSATIHELT